MNKLQNIFKNEAEHEDLICPPRSAKLGGRKSTPKPAATNFADKKSGRIKKPNIEISLQAKANDNIGRHAHKTKTIDQALTTVLALCIALVVLVNFKTSELATYAVVNADEQILSDVMEASPQTLAHVLNAINVGEVE